MLMGPILFVAGLLATGAPEARPEPPKGNDGCPAMSEGSPSMNPLVENGVAYDKGFVPLAGASVLELPTDAMVLSGVAGDIAVFMGKDLSFYGHPPARMNPCTARRSMGCAVRRVGDVLTMGTFGEWGSIEGGAGVALVVRVPESVTIRFRATLSGEKSEAARQDFYYHGREKPADPDYWYVFDEPAAGFTAVRTEPDPKKVAAMWYPVLEHEELRPTPRGDAK